MERSSGIESQEGAVPKTQLSPQKDHGPLRLGLGLSPFKSTTQSQTCTKRSVMVTVWCSAAGLIHYNVLIPSETITSENYAQQNQ